MIGGGIGGEMIMNKGWVRDPSIFCFYIAEVNRGRFGAE
jgi:hypothetical protein